MTYAAGDLGSVPLRDLPPAAGASAARPAAGSAVAAPHCRPRLCARWRARAGKLGPNAAFSSRVVTFPEAVALAEVLTDPAWCHHVATVPARQAGQFYRRVSARLGEGTYQASAADDPLIAWAQHHRSQFTDTPGSLG